MMDHLIDTSFLKLSCFYCLKKSDEMDWKSEFENEIHYKLNNCECGKELRVRVPFYGSGDDNFNSKNKTIEDRI